MEGQHSIMDWVSNIVLMTVGYFTRLVFGDDKLTKWQLIAFYVFCVGVVYIVEKMPVSGTLQSTIVLCCGLVMPNIIKGVISGAKKGQKKVEKKVEDEIDKLV